MIFCSISFTRGHCRSLSFASVSNRLMSEDFVPHGQMPFSMDKWHTHTHTRTNDRTRERTEEINGEKKEEKGKKRVLFFSPQEEKHRVSLSFSLCLIFSFLSLIVQQQTNDISPSRTEHIESYSSAIFSIIVHVYGPAQIDYHWSRQVNIFIIQLTRRSCLDKWRDYMPIELFFLLFINGKKSVRLINLPCVCVCVCGGARVRVWTDRTTIFGWPIHWKKTFPSSCLPRAVRSTRREC